MPIETLGSLQQSTVPDNLPLFAPVSSLLNRPLNFAEEQLDPREIEAVQLRQDSAFFENNRELLERAASLSEQQLIERQRAEVALRQRIIVEEELAQNVSPVAIDRRALFIEAERIRVDRIVILGSVILDVIV